MARKFLVSFIVVLFFSSLGFSTQIISDGVHSGCEEIELHKVLKIYKDPSLFIPNLALIYSEPKVGWDQLFTETPLLTTVKGNAHLMRLGKPREFKGFGFIAKLYEMADARFKPIPTHTPMNIEKGINIVPVKLCGLRDPYGDSLGFIIESDLKEAQKEDLDSGLMPPSVSPNPIPKLRK